MGKLLFHDRDVIGSVAYVDTNSVLVEVEDNEKLSLLNIKLYINILPNFFYFSKYNL